MQSFTFLLHVFALLCLTAPAICASTTARKLFRTAQCIYLPGGSISARMDDAMDLLGSVEALIWALQSATSLDSTEVRNAQQIFHNGWGLHSPKAYDEG